MHQQLDLEARRIDERKRGQAPAAVITDLQFPRESTMNVEFATNLVTAELNVRHAATVGGWVI